MKKFLAFYAVAVLFNLALLVGVICIVLHFVGKYW